MKKPKSVKPFVLGITGGFGTGKSTVARMFARRGDKIIDADLIARDLRLPGKALYATMIRVCGKGVLGKGKLIDPKKVAAKVFVSASLVKRLNAATHPVIISEIKRRIRDSRVRLIILEAPLLLEAHARSLVDRLIVVKSRRQQQISRLLQRRGFSRAEIIARIRRQLPLFTKAQAADFVIDNSGGVANTRKQVIAIRRRLWKS